MTIDPNLRIEDVIGLEEVKQTLYRRLVTHWEYKKDPLYIPSKGILIYGYPGTGKSMVIDAAINSFVDKNKIYAYEVTGTDIDGDLKDTEAIQQMFFERLRRDAKGRDIVLKMDEVEESIPRRKQLNGNTQCATVHKRVSSFLKQMDDYRNRDIFIMCTSNHPNLIEPVFIRSGRIDYKYEVKIPSDIERTELARKYLSSINGLEQNIEIIALGTPRWTGADYKFLSGELRMDWNDLHDPKGILSGETISKTVRKVSQIRKRNYSKFESEYKEFQDNEDESEDIDVMEIALSK